MEKILDTVRSSLLEGNLYAALFVTLTLPDICVALENGTTSGKSYSKWFEENMDHYKGSLSGNDCYALRCSVLHQGIDDITHQRMRDVLEHYVFLSEGMHLNLIKNCVINGEDRSFLQLNTVKFCEDICGAVETWLSSNAGNQVIQDRMQQTLEIHGRGYTHLGAITFQ